METEVKNKVDLIFKSESYDINGACMSVHRKLGAGFLESVYSEALSIEFERLDIPYEIEKKLDIYYGDIKLRKYFRADFICYDSIVVEIKTTPYLTKLDEAQLINYLRATRLKLGILVTFGGASLIYKRLINPNINKL